MVKMSDHLYWSLVWKSHSHTHISRVSHNVSTASTSLNSNSSCYYLLNMRMRESQYQNMRLSVLFDLSTDVIIRQDFIK